LFFNSECVKLPLQSQQLEVLFLKRHSASKASSWNFSCFQYWTGVLALFFSFFLIELLAFTLLHPIGATGLIFGALWALMLACFILCLPRKAGRIVYGILYFFMLIWTLAQAGYYQVFDKMMWLSTVAYAGEGAAFLGDVLLSFPLSWWIGMVLMITLGIVMLKKYPHVPQVFRRRIPALIGGAVFLTALCFLPEIVFLRDNYIYGAKDDFRQSSSYRAAYKTMYDAKKVYDITGIYQLTLRDVWMNEIFPLTPGYRATLAQQRAAVDDYFESRGSSTKNDMTGLYADKNVILVLMESMDDWMITPQDTPTLYRLMAEGINFTNFYTPGYGSARTLNSEFCMNTGIYLPTTGSYVFDFVTNSFKQSFASQMASNGYSGHVFHYNDPDFYSRGVFEPALGYASYVSFGEYTQDEAQLCDETILFQLPEVSELFFRSGKTFNTIITRSAHLGYTYNEIIGYYALQKYPSYRGLYASEEEDCARLKARIVDDMFTRLLQELEARGQLENTVIIAMSDHYTYGYKNMDELYAHSGVSSELLLEKTPCFVWSADGPSMEVTKTLNTSDFLPTMLNLLGITSPYRYLGQDAFDPSYQGYAFFPDGSWIYDGVAYQNGLILMNEKERTVTQEEINAMDALSQKYRTISNLLLTCNYYQ